MKIILKTLSSVQLPLEVENSDKISDVKTKINETHNYDIPSIKLIFSGKVLKDDDTVESSGLKEGSVVVLMAKKKKATPKPSASQSQSQPSQPQTQPQEAPQPVQTQQPQPQQQPQTQTGGTGSGFISGEEYNNAVEQLCEMGFPREQVVRAMRAAYNNPDRAVEYLTTGIPDMPSESAGQTAPQQPQTQTQPQQQPQQQQTPTSGNLRDILRSIPQFEELRNTIQSNPQLLQPILQRIGQQNPQLLQLINSNPDEFIRILNEPGTTQQQQQQSPAQQQQGQGQGQVDYARMAQLLQLLSQAQGGQGQLTPEQLQQLQQLAQMAQQPQSGAIFVTSEERDAINRLAALGFSQDAAAEAYLACDKNEELAANFLFDNMMDYDDNNAGGEDETDNN